MQARIGYFILGILLLLESFYLWMIGMGFSTIFMILSVSVMIFSLAYLQPQFRQKDERIRMIREKGLSYSYLLLMGYLVTFFLLLQFQLISLTAISVIALLSGLMLMTISLTMVVLSLIL